MKTTMTLAGMLTSLLTVAPMAMGQTYVTPSASLGGYGYGGYPSYGYGHHASTFEEGLLQGEAAVIQSAGQANYYNSLAAINGQEAYSRYLQNREKGTETYFRTKQLNRAAREAMRPQRFTYEQHVALAKKQAPDGLSERQYDRTVGRLSWPAVLAEDEFASERSELDRAFGARSLIDSGPASAFYGNVRQLATSLDAKLRAKVGAVSTAEYLAAKKFITGLTVESQQPVVVRTLALAK
jgi:hypothetical protein